MDILEAAAGLLAERGYHGMSMRELAGATGMSLANLYNYFGSKDDLSYALQTRAFDTLLASAREATSSAGEPTARLHAFILSHVRYVATHRDVMHVLVEEAGELPPPRRREVRELKERYFRLGRDLVEAAAAGHAAHPDAIEIERATFSIFGMLNWVYAWYEPSRHGDAAEVARTIHRIALSGLVARAPSRSAQSATERALAQVRVRSPIRLSRRASAGKEA